MINSNKWLINNLSVSLLQNIFVAISLVVASGLAHSNENSRDLGLICRDFSWSDVEELVQPYLNDDLYVALVLKGSVTNENH